jgi:hypothetical protein
LFFSSEGALIPLSRIKTGSRKKTLTQTSYFFLNIPLKSREEAKVVISSDFSQSRKYLNTKRGCTLAILPQENIPPQIPLHKREVHG